jgi:hypothetical protein
VGPGARRSVHRAAADMDHRLMQNASSIIGSSRTLSPGLKLIYPDRTYHVARYCSSASNPESAHRNAM